MLATNERSLCKLFILSHSGLCNNVKIIGFSDSPAKLSRVKIRQYLFGKWHPSTPRKFVCWPRLTRMSCHLTTGTHKNFGIRFGQGCQRFCNLIIATKIFRQRIMRFLLGPPMCLALPKSETSLEQEHTPVTLRIFRRGQHKRSFISCSFLGTHGKKFACFWNHHCTTVLLIVLIKVIISGINDYQIKCIPCQDAFFEGA